MSEMTAKILGWIDSKPKKYRWIYSSCIGLGVLLLLPILIIPMFCYLIGTLTIDTMRHM